MAGKKSSGRKSAFQERADAALLHKLFFEPQDASKLKAKIDSGRYSLMDLFVAKCFGGNETFILRVVDKIFPDKAPTPNDMPAALSKDARDRLAKYSDNPPPAKVPPAKKPTANAKPVSKKPTPPADTSGVARGPVGDKP